MTEPTAFSLDQMEMISARFQRQHFNRHVHEGFCIAVVEQGAQGFECNGSYHVAPTNSLLLINADQLHDGHSADGQQCRYNAIYPQPTLFEWAAADMYGPGAGIPWFDSVVYDTALAQLLRQLFHSLQQGPNLLQTETLFLHTSQLLIQRHSQRKAYPCSLRASGPAIKQLREYLDSHCTEHVSLADLSRLVELNPSYLTRLFKQHTGLPPHSYQLMRRIDRARSLIRAGQSLADIALITGFTDQAHFSRHFRRFTGLTPGRYQQAIRR